MRISHPAAAQSGLFAPLFAATSQLWRCIFYVIFPLGHRFACAYFRLGKRPEKNAHTCRRRPFGGAESGAEPVYGGISTFLEVGFSFLAVALCGFFYGPVVAGLAGIITDTLGYFLRPNGGYFIGFTLNEFLI